MSSKDSRQSRDSRKNAASRAAELRKQQERDERLRSLLSVGGVIVVLALIIGGAFWFQASQTGGDGGNGSATAPSGTNGDYGIVVGQDSADTTMTFYEDFQCPACGQFEQQVGDQVKQAIDNGELQVEYQMVSFLDQASSTQYSSRAHSAAAVVLDEAGKDAFRKFHELLYANQPSEGGAGLSDDQLVELAAQAGADSGAVESGIRDKKFGDWASNATAAMSENDVTGTPTVFIDGEKVDGNAAQAVQQALG